MEEEEARGAQCRVHRPMEARRRRTPSELESCNAVASKRKLDELNDKLTAVKGNIETLDELM